MVAGIYLTMFLINVSHVIVPQLLRWGIDAGIYGGNLNLLGWATSLLLIMRLLQGYITFLQGKWSEVTSQNVAYDLRNEILQKLVV